MIPALTRFVEALRHERVGASPAEVLDAARAMDAVGLERRERFRAALAATLAKTRRDRDVFDRLFDSFFAPPARGSGKARTGRGGEGAAGELRPAATASAPGKKPAAVSRPEPPDPRRRPLRPRDDDRERKPGEVARALEAARVSGAKREGRFRRVVGRREGDRARPAGASPADPLRRDLTLPMTSEDERRLAEEVPRVIEALRLRSGRRLRRSGHGKLWLRGTLRENLGHGGVPFVLPFRRPRPRRTRVVILVDVSWSVARAAGYFLWIASELVRLGRYARVLAFVDRPVDATDAVFRWQRGRGPRPAVPAAAARGPRRAGPGEGIRRPGGTFAEVLRSLSGLNLDAPSDYGRALHALLRSHLRPTGRDTILVILGDARSNRFDPLPWTLQDIARGCRAVLWLVPEPRSRWGTADSQLAGYLPSVDLVAEATDIEGLARGVAEMVKRL